MKLLSAVSPREYERYAEIEARLRALPVLAKEVHRIELLTNELALLGVTIARQKGVGTAPPHFRAANAKAILKQLREIESRASNLALKIETGGGTNRAQEQLALRIDALHEPTITALSSLPMADGQIQSIDWSYFRKGLPGDLLAGANISPLYLRLIADAARRALHTDIPYSNVGRLPDNRARVIADTISECYEQLTGRPATITVLAGTDREGEAGGPFLRFGRDIFDILGIERDFLSYARRW